MNESSLTHSNETKTPDKVYDMWDPAAAAAKQRAVRLCSKLNALPLEAADERLAVMQELFGSVGEHPSILPGFHCDDGSNIRFGNQFLANYNVTILDRAAVTIGDCVMLAPNVVITTASHPMDPQGRRKHLGIAKPVTIGNDVWVGANAVILSGIKIGNNVVVAAGAVVTKDVPDNTLVAGVPARVIRELKLPRCQ